jgi:hypothetical protein
VDADGFAEELQTWCQWCWAGEKRVGGLGVAGANMYLFYFRDERLSARKLKAREGNVGGS